MFRLRSQGGCQVNSLAFSPLVSFFCYPYFLRKQNKKAGVFSLWGSAFVFGSTSCNRKPPELSATTFHLLFSPTQHQPVYSRAPKREASNSSQRQPKEDGTSLSKPISNFFVLFCFVFVVSFFFATFHCQAFEKQGGRRFSNARRVRCSFTSSSPLHAFAKEARREVGKQENKEMLRYERCQRGLFVDSAHRATTLPK